MNIEDIKRNFMMFEDIKEGDWVRITIDNSPYWYHRFLDDYERKNYTFKVLHVDLCYMNLYVETNDQEAASSYFFDGNERFCKNWALSISHIIEIQKIQKYEFSIDDEVF